MSAEDRDEERAYAERLQCRLKILKQEFEAGRVFLNKDLSVIQSLKAVRSAPDGSIDLATVDGLVRSLALAVEFAHDRSELKTATPLKDVQNMYFTFITRVRRCGDADRHHLARRHGGRKGRESGSCSDWAKMTR